MSKYVSEVAELFSVLEKDQIHSFVKKLSLDQIKMVHSEIVPTIPTLARRQQLKECLMESENQIATEKTAVIIEPLQQSETMTDDLKKVYEELTRAILLEVDSQSTRKLLLQRASDDELFVLKRRLATMSFSELVEAWQVDIEVETRKRENLPKEAPHWKEGYQKNWRKRHGNTRWESKVWQNIIKRQHQINQELDKLLAKTSLESHKREPNILSKIWRYLSKTIINLMVGFVKVLFFVLAAIPYAVNKVSSRTPAKDKPKKPEPLPEGFSEEERAKLEMLRFGGAQKVAKATGFNEVGGEKIRDKENMRLSLMTRFGMVLASQMVAGTKNAHHRRLNTVLESLTRDNDDNAAIELVRDAMKGVLDDSDRNPLRGKHACATAGYAELVTAMEFDVMGQLVDRPEEFQQVGLFLSETDKAKIELYYQNMKDTTDLSHMLKKVCSDWGGYVETEPKNGEPENSYKEVSEGFLEKQQSYQDNLSLASRALQAAIKDLKDGASLYLETGLEGHAMQLIIKREGEKIKLSTYDSSGAIENTVLGKGGLDSIKNGRKGFWDTAGNVGLWTAINDLFSWASGLYQLWRKGSESMRKNALSFTVPQKKLLSSEGLGYLSALIDSNSMAGWAKTHIDLKLKHTTMEERSHMGYFERLIALNDQSNAYSEYLKKFTSIASAEAPAEFQDLLQRPQNTSNCYAKKAQSCELYELGKGTYKKVRLAMLMAQREGILNEVCGKKGVEHGEEGPAFVGSEYINMLRTIEPEYLSPAELHEVSMRLCELKRIPDDQYYKQYFTALLDAKTKLTAQAKKENLPVIDRINEKISSHAKELYLYLKNNNREEAIQECFVSAVTNKDPSQWGSEVMPLKTDEHGQMSDSALTSLSAYSNALAWKAAIQLVNHQIKKLSVRERHISSDMERLPHASRLAARAVTMKHLIEANVVSFTTGAARHEEIKIEISVTGGSMKEIDIATFLHLVVKNKASLTHPNVVGILDYLRNSSSSVEERYTKIVYTIQRQAFIDKLAVSLDEAAKTLDSVVTKLIESKRKLEEMILQSQDMILSLKEEISMEQTTISLGKRSVGLKNMELRLVLLEKESEELTKLNISVIGRINHLSGDETVSGSPKNTIFKAKNMLETLTAKDSALKTINAVSQTFTSAAKELENVHQHIEDSLKEFELDDLERERNRRVIQMGLFRKQVITHHLETHAEYRILDLLSAGRFGKEKDKNRELYQQSPEERAKFFKEGKNTLLSGSVFQKIQRVNQRIKAKVLEMVERKVILGTHHHEISTIDSMGSHHAEYIKIDEISKEGSNLPIPTEIKKEWVRVMFGIWLKHENPEKLCKIQKSANSTLAVNDAFHHFLEQIANIKCEALRQSGYPISLAEGQAQEMGMKPIEIERFREKRKEAALYIASKYHSSAFKTELGTKALAKPKAEVYVAAPQIQGTDLVSRHAAVYSEAFLVQKLAFRSLYENTVIDGSTLRFLRENLTPISSGISEEECAQYFGEVAAYLQKLKTFNGLENKGERVTEFCHAAVSVIFGLHQIPPASLVTELMESMLERYRTEDELIKDKDKNVFADTFVSLNNKQRSQLLSNVIKLSLSQMGGAKVNPAFFSMIKQWENVIIPSDEAMSIKIKSLTADGTQPEDMALLKEIDQAIHKSPISLEGICEGQKGLQIALSVYGKETAIDEKLRRIAERLGMRNGDVLLAYQFITFYSNHQSLLSIDGINSTQGRELFDRAFLAAFRSSKTDEEKCQLLDFVKTLPIDQKKHPCLLKVPHDLFIEELLLKAANIDPNPFKNMTVPYIPSASLTDSFIDELTLPNPISTSAPDATDRLFGFARSINSLALKIENEQNKESFDQIRLDELYANLICSKLAYQLTFEQADENTLANMNQNFEFIREMSLVQSNMNTLQDSLTQFSSHLHEAGRAELFHQVFSQFVSCLKFDGLQITLSEKPTPIKNLPGFISLGSNKSLDVLHGVIYVGNHKLGVMPAYIQANIALQALGIEHLPFKPQNGGYIYSEEVVEDDKRTSKIKASIMPQADGSLVIQRELKTLDDDSIILQYIEPDQMASIPIALKRRIKAEHYFIDSTGAIHAYTADFTPILKLSKEQDSDIWSGTLLDHRGKKISIHCNAGKDSAAKKLSTIFPADEIISIDKSTIYVPSISKFLIYNNKKTNYILSDTPTLAGSTSTRHLVITREGSAYTEKELSPSEIKEVNGLKVQISELKGEVIGLKEKVNQLKQDLGSPVIGVGVREKAENELQNAQSRIKLLEGTGLLSIQAQEEIARKIKECETQITEMTHPEFFIFVPKSPKMITLEVELIDLENEVQKAYKAFKEGEKNSGTLATNYNKAKQAYFEGKQKLDQSYAAADYLRTYGVQEGVLKAKDFQSIFHVAEIEDKIHILTQLLGANVPRTPLKSNELEQLKNLKKKFTDLKEDRILTQDEKLALLMLMGIELQHHLLERGACASGKLNIWNREAYNTLLIEFKKEVYDLKDVSAAIPLEDFSELWQAIQSEFETEEDTLQNFFIKPLTVVSTSVKKAISINTNTTQMPIESIGAHSLVQFNDSLLVIDGTQLELEKRLKEGLALFSDSIQAQEAGYYYENDGLFSTQTLEKLFGVTSKHAGVGGLSQKNISELFELMKKDRWVQGAGPTGKNTYQLTQHPSECYSSVKIESYLSGLGFARNETRTISDRLETFLYQTAVNGRSYSIKEGARDELFTKISEAQENYNIEYLEAKDKIESLLADSSPKISVAELYAAYLLNDYSRILSRFSPRTNLKQVEIALNNAMTRLLYYKTELDHFNDVQSTFKQGQEAKAISMLHIKRNYALDRLLESETALDTTETDPKVLEKEQKMQRAFLLFESEFSHRCNTRQVNIFRGLLLDDEMNPDKIDSAQARMGFGKTTLLPLVALYKTGEKLVRFIVPKSALETNTAEMSLTLGHLLAGRAVKDDFLRYRIEADPEAGMGLSSPRLKSLQNAKEDLKKRFSLYERIRDHREVLVQAPNVRNAMECQSKIFLDMLPRLNPKEGLQRKELMECISILNKIRSLETVTIFDELDATQDATTTDVNFTSGEKVAINPDEIYPLELITQTIHSSEDKTPTHLAKVLLGQFNITDDPDDSILKYLTSLEVEQPNSVNPTNSTQIYLMRAVLTDPVMLSVFTEKEPGTDFGVWFQNSLNGQKSYDYDALKTAKEPKSKKPLLITVPYSAATKPKPQGSRFNNPEVTAITTFLYYLDPRTEINEDPHLEFLIDAIRNGLGEKSFLDPTGSHIDPEFLDIFSEIKRLAEIEDPVFRNSERKKSFADLDKSLSFRRMLARTIIKEQIQLDSGSANSNRYEQGTSSDVVFGFSGTAGDTSSHFKKVMLDPAADGNMTLGIMGRHNCQGTLSLDTASFMEAGASYTNVLIQQLVTNFTEKTRTLIDVGGLCKVSNRQVAKMLAIELRKHSSSLNELKGIIFYDDVTNMKKVLTVDKHNFETIVDLTSEIAGESESRGNYFTYYDQSHSRGADIKQMDGVQAVLTLNFAVTNNDYKQAIMRMRKMIDKTSGQSFVVALPEPLKEQIFVELKLLKHDRPTGLTGNDIAFWLRQKELKSDSNSLSVFMSEMDSVVKNAILQQQAAITQLMGSGAWSESQIEIFSHCIQKLNTISPFISGSLADLKAKYGGTYGKITKEKFVEGLKKSFAERMSSVYTAVNEARKDLGRPFLRPEAFNAYESMSKRIIQRREAQLSDTFDIPSVSGSTLSEAHCETENQSQSQSQGQGQAKTQTHSFSEVKNEQIVVDAVLFKHELPFKPPSIDYLSVPEEINQLSLASKTAHMQHLFHHDDPIRCSPNYTFEEGGNDLVPPIRYFVAREVGDPTIILINQDEANQFKKTPIEGWGLYDLRFTKTDEASQLKMLMPLAGDELSFLKDPHHPFIKKLNFTAFRQPVIGESVAQLAVSFIHILKPEQLKPTLDISFEETQNLSEKNAIFHLDKWGFSGKSPECFRLKIEQTPVKFTDKKDHEREMRGVTISLGEDEGKADVFISSKLNKRIKAVEHPKIKFIAEQIQQEHIEAIAERKGLLKNSSELRKQYQITMKTYGEQIKDLETQRGLMISENSNKLFDRFPGQMHRYLNLKSWESPIHGEEALYYLQFFSRDKAEGASKFGFKLDGQWFVEVEDAIGHCINKVYKKNKDKVLNSEELSLELDIEIDGLNKIVEHRFSSMVDYKTHNTVFMGALFSASKEPSHIMVKKIGKKKTEEQPKLNKEVLVWGERFERVFEALFYDLASNLVDPTAGNPNIKFNTLVREIAKEVNTARGAEAQLSEKQLLDNILEVVRNFATKNGLDPLRFERKIKNRLCYSTIAGPSAKVNITSMKEDIRHYVLRGFFEASETPREEQKEFYKCLHDVINEKMPKHDFVLPMRVLDFQTHPISKEEIEDAMKQVLRLQNITTTTSEIEEWTNNIAERLSGQKALTELLEHYEPVVNRPIEFEPLDGQKRKMFSSSHKIVLEMDSKVLDIDNQIAQLKAQRKTEISNIQREWAVVKGKLTENTKKVKVLGDELFSVGQLMASIKKFFGIFSKEHHVVVEEREGEETEFFDAHFDLPTIIEQEVSASAILTFRPPEFYDTRDNLETQREQMHGLEASVELEAFKSIFDPLTGAGHIVEKEALEVQPRESSVVGLLSERAEEQQRQTREAMALSILEGEGDDHEAPIGAKFVDSGGKPVSEHARSRHGFFPQCKKPVTALDLKATQKAYQSASK